MSYGESAQHANTTMSSNRSFGTLFTIVFLIIALSPLWHHAPIRLWALPIALGFGFVTLQMPEKLQRLNVLWFKLGLMLGKLITPLVMGILYMLAILPVGLLRKALGHDPLLMKLDPKAKTYWVTRTEDPTSMKNQF